MAEVQWFGKKAWDHVGAPAASMAADAIMNPPRLRFNLAQGAPPPSASPGVMQDAAWRARIQRLATLPDVQLAQMAQQGDQDAAGVMRVRAQNKPNAGGPSMTPSPMEGGPMPPAAPTGLPAAGGPPVMPMAGEGAASDPNDPGRSFSLRGVGRDILDAGGDALSWLVSAPKRPGAVPQFARQPMKPAAPNATQFAPAGAQAMLMEGADQQPQYVGPAQAPLPAVDAAGNQPQMVNGPEVVVPAGATPELIAAVDAASSDSAKAGGAKFNFDTGSEPPQSELASLMSKIKQNNFGQYALNAGLRMMAAGSRPGATALGSVGEAGIGTLNDVASQQKVDQAFKIAMATEAGKERRHKDEIAIKEEGNRLKGEENKATAALKEETLKNTQAVQEQTAAQKSNESTARALAEIATVKDRIEGRVQKMKESSEYLMANPQQKAVLENRIRQQGQLEIDNLSAVAGLNKNVNIEQPPKAAKTPMALPLGADGRPDKSKMTKGDPYILPNGQVVTWDGT